MTRPASTLSSLRDAAEGLGEIVWAGLNPAPETPLNVEIGPHRRFAVVRQELADYKEVKDALGGTVNDVVLTVVSGALARWLRSRGVRTEGLEMRALVPVSVRAKNDQGTLGNQLTVMRGPLPVYIKDPRARLRFVRKAMDGLKESKQAVGAATLAAVNNLAPPTILAQASRLNFSTRLFNLIVTNIPGPQVPLYVLGRRLVDLFPIAFLPEHHALAVAIMSYNGNMDYGLLGDYDAAPRHRRDRRRDRGVTGRAAGRRAGQAVPAGAGARRQDELWIDERSGQPRRAGADHPVGPRPSQTGPCRRHARQAIARFAPGAQAAGTMSEDLIQPDEVAYRLELTAAQLKIVHTALKSLFDDLGHKEHDVKDVVASVLDKLPGEHEIRAIDLGRELRGDSAAG